MKRLLTLSDAAELMTCSERTVRRLILSGELEALKIRGALRVTPESLELFQRRQIIRFQEENGILPADCLTRCDRM